MRRNELLDRMLNTSAKFHGQEITDPTFELRLVEALLKTVEEYMLPPSYLGLASNPGKKYNPEWDFGRDTIVVKNVWEDET